MFDGKNRIITFQVSLERIFFVSSLGILIANFPTLNWVSACLYFGSSIQLTTFFEDDIVLYLKTSTKETKKILKDAHKTLINQMPFLLIALL